MEYFDVRNGIDQGFEKIKFSDGTNTSYACFVEKNSRGIELKDLDDCGETRIKSEDVPNLIKALQKAAELGWVHSQ